MMESCELPEHLIQLIQSLLTSKQAARTTLVSKSWLAAFITRPNLDFDQADFLRSDDDDTHEIVPFSTYVMNTIARHAESNLKIHSFTITPCYGEHWRTALLVSVSNLSRGISTYVPKKALQHENLVSLTLKGAVIYELDQEEVTRSRLESLCLENVKIESPDLLRRVMSAFPLIQNLSLSRVLVYDTSFLSDLSSSFPVLKDLTLRIVRSNREKGDMLISSRSLERLEIELMRDRKWHHRSSRT